VCLLRGYVGTGPADGPQPRRRRRRRLAERAARGRPVDRLERRPPGVVRGPARIGGAGRVRPLGGVVVAGMPRGRGAARRAGRPVGGSAWIFAAGRFFGAAFLSSRAILPLLGGYLLLRRESGRVLCRRWNLLVLALGCVPAVLGYVALSGYTFAEMWFNVEFT